MRLKVEKAEIVSGWNPGLTLHGYLSKILARSYQDHRIILAKIWSRSCQDLVMVRFYQEGHVPRKKIIENSERKSTKINIYAELHY